MQNYPDYVKSLPEGHPVQVYFEESMLLKSILNEIDGTDYNTEFQKFYNLFNQLGTVEKRFSRKENQLFPYLEKNGWHGPSQGMWAFHDQIRVLIKSAHEKVEARNFLDLRQDLHTITVELMRLMHIEETRLFPNALALLSADEWKEMHTGDEEIGWMLAQKPVNYSNQTAAKSNKDVIATNSNQIILEEGHMTPEQVNLLLKFMPVDLTYVDENDRVIFYNRGENRVFPRSAGIIGREVRFCHPPKSVDTVLRILEEFKKGTKNEAEFWIQFKLKVIHIRYFAIRDKQNVYKGVIEMSQDITDIQKLVGEQRLLSWDQQSGM
ncbi:MAG: PAS domain-containing protein [Pseudobdellovibrio sp.]